LRRHTDLPLSRVMRKHLVLLFLVSIAACGKDSGSKTDWTTKPLASTTVNLGQTMLEIQIPEGLEISEQNADSVRWIVKADEWNNPNVTVRTRGALPSDFAEAKSSEMVSEDATFATEKTLDDGSMILTYKTPGGGRAHYSFVWKTFGAQVVQCTASFAKDGGPPNPDAVTPWLEKVCASLKAK
jgi:hypothetical protein